MDTKESFGAWLRRRRRALDLTQKQLADEVGCSPITIRKFEAGERIPSRELAKLLAGSLAVPSDDEEWFVAFARGTSTAEKPELTQTAESPLETVPNNIPAALTTLIGREADVTAVCQTITQPAARLLTLTGPGGMGKTSLALEAGRRLLNQSPERFPDGITLIELAPVSDPALVLPVIAATLGLKEKGKQASQDALVTYLRSRRQLLILDNFEQVVAAARQLVELLEAAPALHLLVTSRSALRVYGEREYLLDSLALPGTAEQLSPEALLAFSAVSLFVERAQAVKPTFQIDTGNAEAITALCRRLDGLPLAIELAAARCKFFSPAALLLQVNQRLDSLANQNRHLTDRQRTLKGAIEWSYNLLNPDERRLFNRLSVFAGEFSVVDAAAVTGEAADGLLLEQLFGLVSNSVLRYVESADPDDVPHFRFLLTIREYALEQLAASGEKEQVHDHHAAHFGALAEEAEQHLTQAGQVQWLQILERSNDNLRATLAWLLAPEAGPDRQRKGVRMIVALHRFWDIRGHLQEMGVWLEQALGYRSVLSSELLLRLLNSAILSATHRSDFDRARETVGEALDVARQLKDSTQLSTTLHFAGMIAGQTGNYEEADKLLSEALELERQDGPSRGVNLAILLNNLGIVADRLGEYERATRLLEESLILKRARADYRAVAMTLSTMGEVALHQGQIEAADGYLRESLQLRADVEDRLGLTLSLSNMADLSLAQAAYNQAAALYAASQTLRASIGLVLTPIEQAELDSNLALLRKWLGDQGFDSAWTAGASLTLPEAIAYAMGESTLKTAENPAVKQPGNAQRFGAGFLQ